MSAPDNPYAPPKAELNPVAAPGSPLAFAFAVFANHRLAILLAAIWLPFNLGIEWQTYGDDEANLLAQFRLGGLVALFVHPWCLGVVFAACRRERAGRASTFTELLRDTRWGLVFPANFVATLLIGLGTIAFVVPGLVLAVRYAFVEAAAAEERLPSARARARSRELVVGSAWRIAGLMAGFLALGAAASVAFGFAVGFFPVLDHFVAAAVFDTGLDLGHLLLAAALWALYDDAVAAQRAARASAPAPLAPPPLTAGAPA